MKLGRSSISLAGSCLPSPPSPLFGPWLKNTFIPNYVRGSTKSNKEKKNKNPNQQNPCIFQALKCCFGISRATQINGVLLEQPGKEFICLLVGGRRNRLCVTQPGPSRPRRHQAEGQVFLVLFLIFKYQVVTQTQRHAESRCGRSSNPKVQSMKCLVFPQSVPGGRTFPPFHLLCYQPTKGTPLCPQLHLWGISQGQISPKKGWVFYCES